MPTEIDGTVIGRDTVLLIEADTLPGDSVQVFRNNCYVGLARPRVGTPNFELPVRMPDYSDFIYSVQIKRGDKFSPSYYATVIAAPPPPIILDTFTGEIGTVIHDHAPDIGGTWIRKYDVDNNYAYTDNNYALSGAQSLVTLDYGGSLYDRWVWNTTTLPITNYTVKLTFTLKPAVSGDIEIGVFARGNGEDALCGRIRLYTTGNVEYQILKLSDEANAPESDTYYLGTGPGEHWLALDIIGSEASIYLDGHSGSSLDISGYSLDINGDAVPPGTAGFALRVMGDTTDVQINRVEVLAI